MISERTSKGGPKVCQHNQSRSRKALTDTSLSPRRLSASSLFRPRRITSVIGGVFLLMQSVDNQQPMRERNLISPGREPWVLRARLNINTTER
jgi:hypothetical protein